MAAVRCGRLKFLVRRCESRRKALSASEWTRDFGTTYEVKTEAAAASSDEEKCQKELYPNHIQTSSFQKTLLAAGSAALALWDPGRGDMVSVLGETTGQYALVHMQEMMRKDPEGAEILRNQPKISSKTVDLDYLKNLPEGTVGKTYRNFLDDNQVTPDSRLPVRFVDDKDLAYVMQRYREVHDLVHAILGMPTNMLGEVAVKWIEGFQTKLPMCIGGGLFGATRLRPKQRLLYTTRFLPWAIRVGTTSKFMMNIYFERRWEQQLDDLRKEYNIEDPPSFKL